MSDTSDAIDASILSQASAPYKKLQDTLGNSKENEPVMDLLKASEYAAGLSKKRARTSMFDKFKFASK